MKIKLLFSIPIYISICSSTYAQSSVTLWGFLGTGIAYTNNAGKGGSTFQMAGSHAVPFWAISGREELDTDTTAVFHVSQYVAVSNGASSPLESYVGLESNRVGTVTLGSMYDLLADLVPFTSERYTSFLATHPGNLDRTLGTWLNNLIKYKSPVFGGALQFGAQYGFGQQDSTTNTGRTVGVEASFTNGPFQSVLVWESVNGVPYAPYTKLGVSELYGINFSANPSRTVSQNQNTTTLGVLYASDTFQVMGNYSYTRLTAAGQSETAQSIDVGGYKYITKQTRIGGGYSYTKLDTYKWNQFHAHLDYALSKRTSLYVLGVVQLAGSGQLAVLPNQAPASTSRQLELEVGMTHLF
ncbi:porin [Paraburkholderia sediminicola]|uniref:porin n=1 Tax=Paraburkholderia sediminicola TaxID=458836 RepID=UPI0038B8D89B